MKKPTPGSRTTPPAICRTLEAEGKTVRLIAGLPYGPQLAHPREGSPKRSMPTFPCNQEPACPVPAATWMSAQSECLARV